MVCVPVFAMMGLGKLLERKGHLNDDRCTFINWLVYYFSLPALVFTAVARQSFQSFMDPALVVVPLVALLLVVALTMLIARVAGFKGGFAAAFVFGTFWANATYIGFPLCINAFGMEGESRAAVYNAVIVPCFIVISYLLIGFYGAGSGEVKPVARIRKAFLNPILLAAVAGICVALVTDLFRTEEGALQLPGALVSFAVLIGSFLRLMGSMGLPLALLAVGASLKRISGRNHLGALAWMVGCKLALLPLLTLLLARNFLPGADSISVGAAVVLAGTPNAVASYVVSCQLGIERAFVARVLALSTGLSVLTLPVWVYFLRGV